MRALTSQDRATLTRGVDPSSPLSRIRALIHDKRAILARACKFGFHARYWDIRRHLEQEVEGFFGKGSPVTGQIIASLEPQVLCPDLPKDRYPKKQGKRKGRAGVARQPPKLRHDRADLAHRLRDELHLSHAQIGRALGRLRDPAKPISSTQARALAVRGRRASRREEGVMAPPSTSVRPKSGEEWVPALCRKCDPEHVENCPECFGWGKTVTGAPISADATGRDAPPFWQTCPVCGGTPFRRRL